ncbi:MAG: PEP-CTERM sorting domain-containing protein, partial [Planctomycetales bacterium]
PGMDDGHSVEVDAGFSTGGSSGEAIIYVPEEAFALLAPTDSLYFYIRVGLSEGQTGGGEQLGVGIGGAPLGDPIPEPTSMALLGLAGIGGVFWARRRKNKGKLVA